MKLLLRLSNGIDTFTEMLGRVTAWLVPIVIIVGVYNVLGWHIGRLIKQTLTSNLFIELQWYLFSLIFLLSSSYVLKHNEHVRVDVLYSRWSPKTKAWINLIGAMIALLPFFLLLIYFSWPAITFSWSTREMSSNPGGLPYYPIKSFIIVACVLLIIQGISEIIKNLAFLTGHLNPNKEVHKTIA